METRVREVLTEALIALSDPSCCIVGGPFATNGSGHLVDPCDPTAERWCPLGLLMKYTEGEATWEDRRLPLGTRLNEGSLIRFPEQPLDAKDLLIQVKIFGPTYRGAWEALTGAARQLGFSSVSRVSIKGTYEDAIQMIRLALETP